MITDSLGKIWGRGVILPHSLLSQAPEVFVQHNCIHILPACFRAVLLFWIQAVITSILFLGKAYFCQYRSI